MIRTAGTILALLGLLAGGGDAPREDEPTVPAAKAGRITGTITPADQVAQLTAVSRADGTILLPAEFDRETGEFSFHDVPGAAAYDIALRTADGRRIEGIDLGFVDDELLELARIRREQLGLDPPPEGRFTRRDAEDLIDFCAKLDDFMDISRVLYVRGHGRRATVLVELLRTRPFHDSKGDMIWRVELWYFENHAGGWVRLPNQERVLRRERVRPAAWREMNVTYYPRLSVRVARDGSSEPVAFEIPAEPDASRGRPAGTEPVLDTEPHISGIDEDDGEAEPTSRPTTRPAPGLE